MANSSSFGPVNSQIYARTTRGASGAIAKKTLETLGFLREQPFKKAAEKKLPPIRPQPVVNRRRLRIVGAELQHLQIVFARLGRLAQLLGIKISQSEVN